ncbi:MAG: TRAP transporter small permease subunit [Paracoccaceae bacterium]
MQALLNISAVFDAIGRWFGKAVGWLMLPLIAVIMFDVVTRKVEFTRLFLADLTVQYGVSLSTILQELQWHFHGAILLLSFGFGYLANAHVRVDVFRELFPRRRQAWSELVLLIIFAIPFLILMIQYSATLFSISWGQNEGSDSMTGLPWRWFLKFFMPVGFVIAMLAVLATAFRLIVYLFGPEFASRDAETALSIFADDAAELERARLAAEEALKRETGSA